MKTYPECGHHHLMGLTSGLITKGIKGLPGSIHLSLLPDTEVSEQHSTTMPSFHDGLLPQIVSQNKPSYSCKSLEIVSISGCFQTPYVAKDGFELLVILPLSPKYRALNITQSLLNAKQVTLSTELYPQP